MSYYMDEMRTDAIAAHNGECCSESNPCSTRVRLIAGMGTGIATNPNFNLPTPRYGSGNGNTVGHRVSASITPAQESYLRSLISERDFFSLSQASRDGVTAFQATGTLTKAKASALISELKGTALASHVSTNGFSKDVASKVTATVTKATPLEAGYYGKNDKIIKVQVSKSSGYPYGSVLNVATGKFDYAKGSLSGLTADDKLTLEAAKVSSLAVAVSAAHCSLTR
jgi:hypothetical protein